MLFLNNPSFRETTTKFIFDWADWSTFRHLAIADRDPHSFDNVGDATEYITSLVFKKVTESIPQTSGIIRTKYVPWWNREVAVAMAERRIATHQYYKTKLPADKILFERPRARARFLIKDLSVISGTGFSLPSRSLPLPTRSGRRFQKSKASMLDTVNLSSGAEMGLSLIP